MKYIAALLIFLFVLPAQAGWKFLERETIYDNPLAHPRSPVFGLSINTSKHEDQQITYLDVLMGGRIGIISFSTGSLQLQSGVEAGGWFTLGWKEGTSFSMLTEDYLVSAPLSIRYRGLSATVKWNHISAHLGDGMNDLLEKDLEGKKKREYEFYDEYAESKGMDLKLTRPLVYSRDFISLLLSYKYLGTFRNYIHLGYSYKIIPEELGKWYAGAGMEIQWWPKSCSPYTAIDATWNQDTGGVDLSTQVGWMMRPNPNSLAFYIALTGYTGHNRRGQLHEHELQQIGIVLFFQ